MAEIEHNELRSLLTEAAAKERQALRRATMYTAIPVLIGLLLIGFFTYRVIKLRSEIKQLEEKREALKRENESLTQEFVEVNQENEAKDREIEGKVEKITRDAQSTGAKTDIKRQAENILQAISGERWIIMSGDRTLEDAQYETQRAKGSGYTDVGIYLRQGSYRTVIKFSSEAAAEAKIADVRARLSKTAYLRDLAEWCPNPQNKGAFYQCPN